MSNYSDPTANRAIGAVDKELSAKRKRAQKLKELWEKGIISDYELAQEAKQFSGVFAHLLKEIFRQ